MQKKLNDKKQGVFTDILILTGFLLLLEISYFIQCNRAYLSDYTFVSKNLQIPVTIVPGILSFVCAQIGVHLLFCIGVWIVVECVYSLVSSLRRHLAYSKNLFAVSIWILAVATILTANQYYLPNSKFSELTSLILFSPLITKIAFIILATCCAIVSLLALFGAITRHKILLAAALSISITTFLFFKPQEKPLIARVNSSQPDIILIGVDSLRPDFLGYFGSERPTPFFDSFLEQASVFTDAVTPLARTFPSWSSLLTGQYPRLNHIRSNLAVHDNLNFNNTLPAILQRNGYKTIYATDETRFSNIDKNFGFDRIIGPPMGLNDFLIGNFNDFPLTNLLINTEIGKLLFPYNHANRPVAFAYHPDSFLNTLKPILQDRRSQPLFLSVHFCLTHAPYIWKDFSGQGLSMQQRYVASIARVDKQISDFFALLKQYHLLDNSIVVLLSDHGEALEFPGDRITEKDLYISSNHKNASVPKFYPPALDEEEVNQSAGHGTDVLGLPQYHTLLAFRLYGRGESKPGNIPDVVSLLDIKPTLLELIGRESPASSGISLVRLIEGGPKLTPRHIFLESDFSPEAIRTVYPEERKVLLEGIDIFQINQKTTRLTIKNEMIAKIIGSKQYADIYNEWMLALYPQDNSTRMAILVNLKTGEWTNDLQTPFAKNSPAQAMLAQLRAFYGEEISSISG